MKPTSLRPEFSGLPKRFADDYDSVGWESGHPQSYREWRMELTPPSVLAPAPAL